MSNEYACIYCGYDGGFHGCRAEVKHTIEVYLSNADVLDADELTSLIGALGFWKNA